MGHICARHLAFALFLSLAAFISGRAAAQCSLPPPSIDTTNSICAGAVGKAVVEGPAGASYSWHIYGGTLLNTIATDTAIFKAGPGYFPVTLEVTITTPSGCSRGSRAVAVDATPDSFTLTPPAEPWCANSGGHVASTSAAGPTLEWSIVNGTITDGQGTPSVTFETGAISPTLLYLTSTNESGCSRTSTLSYERGRDPSGNNIPSDSGGIAPSQTVFPNSGGPASVALRTSCSWTATSTAAWLSITSATSGSGDATVAFTVAANTLSRSRSAILTIGGVPLSIVQDGTGVPDGDSMSVTTIAGTPSLSSGFANGPAMAARFDFPSGTAVDAAGNVYVADRRNYVIRRIDTSGQVATFAGASGMNGYVDGPVAAARFSGPSRLALDDAGNLYVTDSGYNSKGWEAHTLRKITPAGVVSTVAGRPGVAGYADGIGTAALFHRPEGIDVGPDGNIYVADSLNTVIRRVTPGGVVTTVAGIPNAWDYSDGPAGEAAFGQITDVAVAPDGTIYVADLGIYGSPTIRRIDTSGNVSAFAGDAFGFGGNKDGTGTVARFTSPYSMTWAAGDLYVGDAERIRRITPGADVTTVAGGGASEDDGSGLALRLFTIRGIATGVSNDVTFADTRGRIRRMNLATSQVTTLAGEALPVPSGSGDGTGAGAVINSSSMVFDAGSGNVLLAEARRVRQVTPEGVVTTITGQQDTGVSVDGPLASATFSQIRGITVTPSGDIYVIDGGTLRRISGGNVTTVAGRPDVSALVDGTGSGAAFIDASALTSDPSGVIYVADGRAIRRVTSTGLVTTIAGSATLEGYADGSALAARFDRASAIAFGPDGALYVGERNPLTIQLNNRIRRVTLDGMVTTVAGMPRAWPGGDGSGADARFTSISGIAFDPDGNLYVADGATLRKMAPAGTVTTVLGMPNRTGTSDGTGAHARLGVLAGITSDASGNIYFVDSSTVRRASLALASDLAPPEALTATATSTSSVSVNWTAVAGAARYDVYRSMGGSPFSLRGPTTAPSFSDSGLSSEVTYLYFVRAVDAGGAQSLNSNVDGATTLAFTDDPLLARRTLVKTVHFIELRKAVDAYRTAANLPSLSADGTLVAGAPARTQHLTILRTALNEARAAAGTGGVTFTNSITAGSSVIRAIDVHELRNATK